MRDIERISYPRVCDNRLQYIRRIHEHRRGQGAYPSLEYGTYLRNYELCPRGKITDIHASVQLAYSQVLDASIFEVFCTGIDGGTPGHAQYIPVGHTLLDERSGIFPDGFLDEIVDVEIYRGYDRGLEAESRLQLQLLFGEGDFSWGIYLKLHDSQIPRTL
ncbi:hypothetical protein SDC9_144418 [bioreactor metagenome]|uniref:Uncharacterized protein n=1 Tax=bioreactor metagenome TaxID=1076179 RepID=A0A645E6X5_9ZZZZ